MYAYLYMHMYMCIYIYMYIYICIYIFTYIYIYIYSHTYINTQKCMFTYIHICVYPLRIYIRAAKQYMRLKGCVRAKYVCRKVCVSSSNSLSCKMIY